MTPTHVLLATDGSAPSLEAARLVRDLLNPAALARVTILAVVPPLEIAPFTAHTACTAAVGSPRRRWTR